MTGGGETNRSPPNLTYADDPATGKNTDAGVPKGRLPGGRAFMPRVSLKRLTRI